MIRRNTIFVRILLVAAVLMAGMVTALAAAAAGTGPDDALAPTGEWQPLHAGESHWYAFQYPGDGSQIQVQLEAVPQEGASFDVWTPGGIERWALGLEAGPIGGGSAAPSAGGKLLWSGSFNTPGTYYVVVEHAGNQPGATYYLLEVSGDGVSFSTAPPPATATPEPARPRSVAPSGPTGKLAFQTSMGGNIYSINVDGTKLQRITSGIDPVWSPAGMGEARIAFVRWSEPRGVWVADVASGNERRVFDWSETRYPSWSPDGEQIVFTRNAGGTTGRELCFRGFCFTIPPRTFWKLGIVDTTAGTFSEPLPNSDAHLTPDWSPSGDRIVFDAVHGLRLQSVDGHESYQLTSDAKDTSPVWSPSGDQVAFVRRQHDHWEIYAVDADGSGIVRRLTDTPEKPNGEVANSVSPAWSPDGNYIAFLTDRTGRWEIWVMRADGSNPRPMFDTALDGVNLDYSFQAERAISWTR
jgi:Tol biopolymer transport system component